MAVNKSETSSLLGDAKYLEDVTCRTVNALAEAELRLQAIRFRGPVNSPNLEEWEAYTEDLRRKFGQQLQLLERFLNDIKWEGSPMPLQPKNRLQWWGEVRAHIRQDEDGTYEVGDSMATLTAYTFDGTQIQGADTLCVVP